MQEHSELFVRHGNMLAPLATRSALLPSSWPGRMPSQRLIAAELDGQEQCRAPWFDRRPCCHDGHDSSCLAHNKQTAAVLFRPPLALSSDDTPMLCDSSSGETRRV